MRVDRTLEEANPADYHGLLVPGGFISPDFLRQSQKARDFVRAFDHSGKPIATICHGPWVFASAGLVQGRRFTSWPGIRDDIVNAGGVWQDEPVVRDSNLVSCRGPQDLLAFNEAIIELFSGREQPEERPALPAESAPQPSSPPAAALAAATLLPKVRPLRTAAALATAGAADLAVRAAAR